MKLRCVSTGTPWERKFGYPRAVRAGDVVAVSGTVAADEEGRPLAADAYGQGREIFRIIDGALRRLGSRLDNVFRLRLYYADPEIGPEFSRALADAFPDGIPALTGVRVTGLVDPAFLVEVEADALVYEQDDTGPRPAPEWDEGGD